ncbi:hypothetical protein AwPolaro_02480 [Polaromonas sp.]|nr:hypothetical protein AwPolaro_02480 [Polaromonas sp.]
MDFIDQIRTLASTVNSRSKVLNEEATKTSMVLPLIKRLGYDIFDPLEVTPEFVSDVGTKKGEKVDYAILSNGKPIILFECKKASTELNADHVNQLFRYFHATEARFGILTNGLIYKFFTDLEDKNKMDEKPFFEFNILDFKDSDVMELKKFTKTAFNRDALFTRAMDLKLARAIKDRLTNWITDPPDGFVKLLSADLAPKYRPAVKKQFADITKQVFKQLIDELVNERLKETTPILKNATTASPFEKLTAEGQNLTTENELMGLNIVQGILRGAVDSNRLSLRNYKTCPTIVLDSNSQKPICRLSLNSKQSYMIFFDENKKEVRKDIKSINDINSYARQLTLTVTSYLA